MQCDIAQKVNGDPFSEQRADTDGVCPLCITPLKSCIYNWTSICPPAMTVRSNLSERSADILDMESRTLPRGVSAQPQKCKSFHTLQSGQPCSVCRLDRFPGLLDRQTYTHPSRLTDPIALKTLPIMQRHRGQSADPVFGRVSAFNFCAYIQRYREREGQG
jgi:hypothetical protein